MVFKIHTPDYNMWTDYFMNQIKGDKSEKGHKSSVVNGGVDHGEDSSFLSVAGRFNIGKKQQEPVSVNMTSAVKSTIDMAKSEIENIKGQESTSSVTSMLAAKRKSSKALDKPIVKKRKNKSSTVKRSTKHNDVFSKRPSR